MGRPFNYAFLECAAEMPPLRHSQDDGAYDVCKSEVCQWLCKQPEVMQKVFYMAAQTGVIYYDPVECRWVGRDFTVEKYLKRIREERKP